MSFEGLDPGQLENLARQVDQDAQRLNDVTTTMTGVMATLALFWHGPAAISFGQDWAWKLRPSLESAYSTLTDLHGHLVSNVNQQRSASKANGGSILDTVTSDGGVAWRDAQKINEWTSPVSTLADLVPDAPDLPVLTAIGAFDMVMSVASIGVDLWDAGSAAGNHQYAAAGGDLVDATAEGLKAGGPKYPVPYLSGVALTLVKEDYDLAGQVNWHQGLPNPFTSDNFKDIYAPAFKAVPGEMVDPLRKAFF